MILDEPFRGGFFRPGLLGVPGGEQLRRFVAGREPTPPIHHLTGMRPTETGDGTSTFTMPATGWLAAHVGAIPGGFLAVLADGPLGSAIQSTLPAGTTYTTSELSMSYLRPAFPDGRDLVARGRAIHTGRSLALSDTVVTDADGREVAHATSRCFLFPPMETLPEVPDDDHVPVAYDTPDPYLRSPVGLVLGAAADAMSGFDLYTGCVNGDVAPPPLHHLTGSKPVEVGRGSVTWTMPASPWLCSPTGFVEGGFLVYLADSAVATATATLVPAGTASVPIDVTVKFIRPVPPDGRDLVAKGHVVNHGRSLSVAMAEVRNADGKLVATALGSSMLLPGRSVSPSP